MLKSKIQKWMEECSANSAGAVYLVGVMAKLNRGVSSRSPHRKQFFIESYESQQ